MDLLDLGVYLRGQLSLLLSVSYKVVLSGDWTTGSSFAEFKSPSENLANVQKDCLLLKAILKKLLRLG